MISRKIWVQKNPKICSGGYNIFILEMFDSTVDKLSFESFMIWKTWLTFGRLRFNFFKIQLLHYSYFSWKT